MKQLRQVIRKILLEASSKKMPRPTKADQLKEMMGTPLKCPNSSKSIPPDFAHPQGLSGVIKRQETAPGKGWMWYSIKVGNKIYEGAFTGYGYASRGIDDFGPFSMRLLEKHPDIPMPLHEPQIVYAWAHGDLRIFDV